VSIGSDLIDWPDDLERLTLPIADLLAQFEVLASQALDLGA
jgi:hypothetical protein